MSRAGILAAIGGVAALCGSYFAWNDNSPPPVAAAPLEGEGLFHAKGCATCHTGPDSTAQFSSQFPRLRGASQWAGTRRPGMSAEQYLKESMLQPGAFISPVFHASGPTGFMPDLHLTEAEADALVAYLLGR